MPAISSQGQSPEDRAINLASKYVPPESTAPIEDTIKQWLKAKKGILRVHGWNAKKIDDQTYLVGYTYDEGPGSSSGGWVFEVNLNAEIVREVIGDPQLEQKYGEWAREREEKQNQHSESSFGLGEFSVFLWLLLLGVITIPLPAARILRRAGRSPGWALLCFIPILAWIGLWVFSFVRWPALDKKAT